MINPYDAGDSCPASFHERMKHCRAAFFYIVDMCVGQPILFVRNLYGRNLVIVFRLKDVYSFW